MEYIVVGDVHGDLNQLIYPLLDFLKNPDNTKLIYLGDYFDRGDSNVYIYEILFTLKHSIYANNIILIEGNHESLAESTRTFYGNYSEASGICKSFTSQLCTQSNLLYVPSYYDESTHILFTHSCNLIEYIRTPCDNIESLHKLHANDYAFTETINNTRNIITKFNIHGHDHVRDTTKNIINFFENINYTDKNIQHISLDGDASYGIQVATKIDNIKAKSVHTNLFYIKFKTSSTNNNYEVVDHRTNQTKTLLPLNNYINKNKPEDNNYENEFTGNIILKNKGIITSLEIIHKEIRLSTRINNEDFNSMPLDMISNILGIQVNLYHFQIPLLKEIYKVINDSVNFEDLTVIDNILNIIKDPFLHTSLTSLEILSKEIYYLEKDDKLSINDAVSKLSNIFIKYTPNITTLQNRDISLYMQDFFKTYSNTKEHDSIPEIIHDISKDIIKLLNIKLEPIKTPLEYKYELPNPINSKHNLKIYTFPEYINNVITLLASKYYNFINNIDFYKIIYCLASFKIDATKNNPNYNELIKLNIIKKYNNDFNTTILKKYEKIVTEIGSIDNVKLSDKKILTGFNIISYKLYTTTFTKNFSDYMFNDIPYDLYEFINEESEFEDYRPPWFIYWTKYVTEHKKKDSEAKSPLIDIYLC